MITSFGNRDTERVFSGEQLSDLLIPPSNRLQKLKGDKKDQWRISIDKQFRICFTWNKGNAEEVIIEDYH